MSKYISYKNGIAFIPWAQELSVCKQYYPKISYVIHERTITLISKDEKGNERTEVLSTPCFRTENGNSGWVKITVKNDDDAKPLTEIYPVTDFRNKPIPFEQITSTDINKSVARSLTKCLAKSTGIGLYVYASEEEPKEAQEAKELQAKILDLINRKSKKEGMAEKIGEICKSTLDPDLNGDPRLCDDPEVLEKLRKKLLALR